MLLGSMNSKHGVDDFIKRHPHKDNTLPDLPLGIRFPNPPTYGTGPEGDAEVTVYVQCRASRSQGQMHQFNIMWKKERCLESASRNDSWGEAKLVLLFYKSKMWLILSPVSGRSLILHPLELIKVWWELLVGSWNETNWYWIWNAHFSKLINDWNDLSRDVMDSLLLVP